VLVVGAGALGVAEAEKAAEEFVRAERDAAAADAKAQLEEVEEQAHPRIDLGKSRSR